MASTTPKTSFPVDFSLLDENSQAILPVDGEGGRTLVLRMTNRSGRDLTWIAAKDGQSPSKDFHHLQLTFRPGVLSEVTLGSLKGQNATGIILPWDKNDWSIAPGAPEPDGSTPLFFIFKPKSSKGLPAGNAMELKLARLSASASVPHGLTRVELKLDQFELAGLGKVPSEDTRRHCHLSVLRGGWVELPLRVGFKGAAVIPADGTITTLTLVLHNPGAKPFKMDGGSFVLYFDQKDPWKLSDTPVVSWKWNWEADSKYKSVTRENRGNRQLWPITPAAEIPADGSIEIKIEKLVSHTVGTTNLYLDSFDIPGLDRTKMVIPISRSGELVKVRNLAWQVQGIEEKLKKIDEILSEVQALCQALRLQALVRGEATFEPDQLTRAILSSAADRYEIYPQKAPIIPGVVNITLPAPKQKWRQIGQGLDASRNFVLINSKGEVRPVVWGRLGDALPLPHGGTFDKIGEFRGSPMLSSEDRHIWWWFCGAWRQDQFVSGDPKAYALGGVHDVGEGWIAVERIGGGPHTKLAAAIATRLVKDKLSFHAIFNDKSWSPGPPPQSPTPMVSIGGSAQEPLAIDAQGQVWGLDFEHIPSGAARSWSWDSAQQHMIWVKRDCPEALDLNAEGILIRKNDKAVMRYQGGRWERLDNRAGERVGGTWRNPLVVGSGNLYRLEDDV